MGLKNFLKRLLPPPTRTFYREINRVIDTVNAQEKLSEITQQNAELRTKLDEVKKQNSELSARTESLAKQNQDVLDKLQRQVDELQKQVVDLNNQVFKKDYAYLSSLPVSEYERELKEWYFRQTGEFLNLENPRTFNEKMQWLKLYDATPLKTRLADKYLVREWIAEKIGQEYLIPLLGVWDDFDEIDFNKLPEKFVLKTNHGCGNNIIVKDKSKIDYEDLRKKITGWLYINYAFSSGFEMHYLNIPPKIIAEEYIADIDGNTYDYKFMCFDGQVKFIWVDTGRYTDHRRTLFNLNWEKMTGKSIGKYQQIDLEIPKPSQLEKMISFSKELSKNFSVSRIDFYEVKGKLYFGEITFTSGTGTVKIMPDSFAIELGDMIKLPVKSEIPTLKKNV